MSDNKRKKVTLTDAQKEFILKNYTKLKLPELTRKTFNDDSLDGRSKQGMEIKLFLESKNKNAKTTVHKKRKIVLTKEQEEYILRHAHDMKPMQIARIIFEDNSIHQLSSESIRVQNFIKDEKPSALQPEDEHTEESYQPPQNLKFTLKRINEIMGESYDLNKMNVKYKKGVEQLMKYLRSPRFVATINTISSVLERNTFEAEFIKTTWNKPDLTADEINLYINVINEYIIQSRISRVQDKLNRALEQITDNDDKSIKISMGLSDAIKGKTEEYHKSVARQESLVKQLEGERSKRIANHKQQNRSIAALVELFKEEEERKNLVRIAELRKKKVKEEINRYETEDELLVRVFGITEEELLD